VKNKQGRIGCRRGNGCRTWRERREGCREREVRRGGEGRDGGAAWWLGQGMAGAAWLGGEGRRREMWASDAV
jgi:hypothetical protein